ncbi:hypothetical protein CEXT_193621 [Caerostris extrusa]|uniref:Secreted protein n=1 Tax=Caerostris extrusa TaxID=172846 RepID=A0AAV4XIN3_CAEEX|nr:hypothetical protein CEXT_193621 [Caerostris extrusa]
MIISSLFIFVSSLSVLASYGSGCFVSVGVNERGRLRIAVGGTEKKATPRKEQGEREGKEKTREGDEAESIPSNRQTVSNERWVADRTA